MFQFHFHFPYRETGNIILTLQFGFCFINFRVAFKDIYFLAMYDNSFFRNNITDVAPTYKNVTRLNSEIRMVFLIQTNIIFKVLFKIA